MMSHRPTLEDVAREAGCCQSTVSYVILRTKPISREVTERVKAAIVKLGYRPYRTRRRPGAPKIALLVSNFTDPLFLHLFSTELLKRGFSCQPVILPGIRGLDENGMTILAGLNDDPGITGIINTHHCITSLDLLARCKSKPCVIYNREGSMLSHTHQNHYAVGALAAQRCLQLGYPKVGILFDGAKYSSKTCLQGCNGFSEYAAQHGKIKPLSGWLKDGDDYPKRVVRCVKAWYQKGVRLIFCWSSRSCITITQWAYRERLRIPEDLSLLAFDTNDFCKLTSPPVTALVPHREELIRGTVEEMIARLKGEDFPERTLQPYWIEHGSVIPYVPPKRKKAAGR